MWGTDNNGQVAQENKGKQGKIRAYGGGHWQNRQSKETEQN